jgi:serine protease Do
MRRQADVWLFAVVLAAALEGMPGVSAAQPAPGIERVRPSIVAIGTYQATRVPQCRFLGTGFFVGDGTLAATNAHVLAAELDAGSDPEVLVAMLPSGEPSRGAGRRLTRVAVDLTHDLALLQLDGLPLRPLVLRDSAPVVEGDHLLFTGFPIGAALGLYPATHRATAATIAPVVIPAASGGQRGPA